MRYESPSPAADTYTGKLPTEFTADVAIFGAGPGGYPAAVTLARMGYRVLLIEATGQVGGAGTLALASTSPSARTDRRGRHFGGIGKELESKVHKLASALGLPPGVEYPDLWRIASTTLCADTGVRMLLHTCAVDTLTSSNRIDAVILASKEGLAAVRARAYVDATGDGDIAFRAGVPYQLGSGPTDLEQLQALGHDVDHIEGLPVTAYPTGEPMPCSLMFILDEVDVGRARPWINKRITMTEVGAQPSDFQEPPFSDVSGFQQDDSDRLPLPQWRVLFSPLSLRGRVLVNMSRLRDVDATRVEPLSRAEVDGLRQLVGITVALRRWIPGFEGARLTTIATQVGVRETRRFQGHYTLTGTDIVSARRFADAVARGSYMVDIHDPTGHRSAIGRQINGDHYDIPYRCLVPVGIDNLLLSGRCISTDHVAHSSVRIQGTAMLISQAAGVAAAQMIERDQAVGNLDVRDLQRTLIAQGVCLEMPNAPAMPDKASEATQ